MFEKNQPNSSNNEKPKILLPEELKKIMEPKKEERPEAIKTQGERQFLQRELGAKRVLLKQMKDKGLNTDGLGKDIDTIERKLGGGHA